MFRGQPFCAFLRLQTDGKKLAVHGSAEPTMSAVVAQSRAGCVAMPRPDARSSGCSTPETLCSTSYRGVMTVTGPDPARWAALFDNAVSRGLEPGCGVLTTLVLRHCTGTSSMSSMVLMTERPSGHTPNLAAAGLVGWLAEDAFLLCAVGGSVTEARTTRSCGPTHDHPVRVGPDSLAGASFRARDRLDEITDRGSRAGTWALEARHARSVCPGLALTTPTTALSRTSLLGRNCTSGQELAGGQSHFDGSTTSAGRRAASYAS